MMRSGSGIGLAMMRRGVVVVGVLSSSGGRRKVALGCDALGERDELDEEEVEGGGGEEGGGWVGGVEGGHWGGEGHFCGLFGGRGESGRMAEEEKKRWELGEGVGDVWRFGGER